MVEDPRQRDGARVRFPPPLVYLLALGSGIGLGRLVTLEVLGGLPLVKEIGATAVAVGVIMMGIALGLFARTGQNPEPWTTTPAIITTGIYRFTRNPMYLGMTLVQTGIGLIILNVWIVALAPVSMAVVYRIAIRPEEDYLTEKFGAEYETYRQRVRRWL
ncbi:MAG: isoprenylcysteine carboxylmethyltransferase family protein [Pseudomonadota bacterium]